MTAREWSAVSPFYTNSSRADHPIALARCFVALWITQVTLTLLPSFLQTGILIVCRFSLHALQTLNNSCVKYESDLTWSFLKKIAACTWVWCHLRPWVTSLAPLPLRFEGPPPQTSRSTPSASSSTTITSTTTPRSRL